MALSKGKWFTKLRANKNHQKMVKSFSKRLSLNKNGQIYDFIHVQTTKARVPIIKNALVELEFTHKNFLEGKNLGEQKISRSMIYF